MKRSLLIGLAVAHLAACGSEVEDDVTPEPDLVIGEGNAEGTAFTAFADGATAHLVYGPQGGYHFWFGARVRELDPEGLVYVIQCYRDDLDGVLANQFTTRIDMEDAHHEGYFQTAEPVTMILCPSPQGIGADGKDLRVHVTVRDGFGHQLEDEVTVRTECPADDERCPATCAGE